MHYILRLKKLNFTFLVLVAFGFEVVLEGEPLLARAIFF